MVLGAQCAGYCREKEDCLGDKDVGDCPGNLMCCKNTGKSKEKCQSYAKYVYQESQGVVLMARSLLQNVSDCHIEAVPLVVGGEKAKPKEFPHMAAVGYGKSLSSAIWLCGGALISENYVLSAAHCASSGESGDAKFIRLGGLNLKEEDDSTVQKFTITERIVHPRYKASSKYDDIALFKFTGSIRMDGHTRPACLYAGYDEIKFKKAVATGWGKTNYNSYEGSPDLMKVYLDVIDQDTCSTFFTTERGGNGLARGLVPSQLCAGVLEGGKDTCQGDSGGPLQVVASDPYCMYKIIGITSFGKFCGFKNSPAVYTRVSNYVPWIESVVWPSGN
ncbi:hypothetical protein RUM44_000901 [Polyplax serrata]|uniref:Peptidase S1 domain-containing protein n=1 Tax=Polyplax serrata TaxID=468196 RepID=A0ABR1B6C9_POLSC